MFTVKDVESFNDGTVEVFIDELTKIENKEVVFSDNMVQVFFDDEGLFDPKLFNEQTLEEEVLGSIASYRNKIIVSYIYDHYLNLNTPFSASYNPICCHQMLFTNGAR